MYSSHRKSTAKLKNQYQYPDSQIGDEDAFAREPFVVHFQAPETGTNRNVAIESDPMQNIADISVKSVGSHDVSVNSGQGDCFDPSAHHSIKCHQRD